MISSVKPEDIHLPEILFEFRKIKNFVRVTAIDPTTGIEAIIVGASDYSTEHLKRLAIRKLKYVIAKFQNKTSKN